MNALSFLSEIFRAPIGYNVAVACFVLAATCMALNYHRRIREIQKQNDTLISLLGKIEANTQSRLSA